MDSDQKRLLDYREQFKPVGDFSQDLESKPYNYQTEVPSPYVGKFPRLTAILNADPSSISKEETKQRLNSYYNELKEKNPNITDPGSSLQNFQDPIANSYIDDVLGREKNLKDLTPKILKDFGTNNNANVVFKNSREPLYSDGQRVDGTTYPPTENMSPLSYQDNANIIVDKNGSPESTLFHELRHYHDITKGYNGPEENFRAPATQPNNPFELSKNTGSYLHHQPLGENKEDAMLMYPFEKIGYKKDPSYFQKITDLLNK